ncbi:MAG: hypothetical protein FD125_998 [bacterium]|nr:MAG: hypothetical protein FD125_998 [bacterium]
MGTPDLLALSLGLSVIVAALGWAGGRGVERLSADPRLRDRVWAAALILPALPPLAVSLLLLTPAPVREIAPPSAGFTADLVTSPIDFVAVAPSAGPLFDATASAWALLGVAILLSLVRLAALALRARRLLRIIDQAQAPSPAVAAMVEDAARHLAIRPPLVRVSATAPEALLAVNPLVPVLRARRAAAREEACDALALTGAGPEVRRAYARSLIEALRDRAGPQTSGGLPALTFTGAGRTTAMKRLRAVLNPAPAAGRRSRLMACGLGSLIAALAGAGTLAVAAEREAVTIFKAIAPAIGSKPAGLHMGRPDTAAEAMRLDEPLSTVDQGTDTRTLLNGAPLPEGLPMWAVAAGRVDIRTGETGVREVDLILPFTGRTPVSVNGRRMPAGFPASGIIGGAVERVDVVGDHVMYTLKPEADVRRDRMNARRDQGLARMAAGSAQATLSPEQQARYRNPTAREYQALCASSDPGDDGFCSGVMFAQMQGRSLCLPADLDHGSDAVRAAALSDLVARGKAEIARGPIRSGDGPGDVARAALARAYPCNAAQADPSDRAVHSRPEIVPVNGDQRGITPADAVDVSQVQADKPDQGPRAAIAPAPSTESEFLAERRAEREAARRASPNESGLRLPGWPRPDRPTSRDPFAYERRAADPQNRGVPRG